VNNDSKPSAKITGGVCLSAQGYKGGGVLGLEKRESCGSSRRRKTRMNQIGPNKNVGGSDLTMRSSAPHGKANSLSAGRGAHLEQNFQTMGGEKNVHSPRKLGKREPPSKMTSSKSEKANFYGGEALRGKAEGVGSSQVVQRWGNSPINLSMSLR